MQITILGQTPAQKTKDCFVYNRRMEIGIYGIYRNTEILYIGQSVNIQKRKTVHLWQLRNNKHPNSYLQHVYNENNDIKFKTLEIVENRKNLTSREIFYIKKLKPLCNFILPDKNDNWIFSEERNKKISLGNLNKPKSIEHRKNISLSKMGNKNPMYGKPAWNRGVSRYGRENPMFGKKHTDEYKQMMSNLKGTKFNIELAKDLRDQGLSYEEISHIVNAPRKRISKVLRCQN